MVPNVEEQISHCTSCPGLAATAVGRFVTLTLLCGTLHILTGHRPQESKDTLVRLALSFDEPRGDGEDWHASYVSQSDEDKSLVISILPAADAIVGRYRVFVEAQTNGPNDTLLTHRREFENTFVVLFNAWCEREYSLLLLAVT